MASGGLASAVKAKSDVRHDDVSAKSANVVQVENLLKFESANSLVQVDKIYNPCISCDEVVQVENCLNDSQAMDCDVAQVDTVFNSNSCDEVVQVENCLNDSQAMECDVAQVDTVFNSNVASVAQVGNCPSPQAKDCDVVPVE